MPHVLLAHHLQVSHNLTVFRDCTSEIRPLRWGKNFLDDIDWISVCNGLSSTKRPFNCLLFRPSFTMTKFEPCFQYDYRLKWSQKARRPCWLFIFNDVLKLSVDNNGFEVLNCCYLRESTTNRTSIIGTFSSLTQRQKRNDLIKRLHCRINVISVGNGWSSNCSNIHFFCIISFDSATFQMTAPRRKGLQLREGSGTMMND